MRLLKIGLNGVSIFLFICFSSVLYSEPTKSKPVITILATGGTIAGAGESSVGAIYKSSQLAVDAMLAAVPNLNGLAEVQGEQFSQISSQDMNDALWLRLAKRVNAVLEEADAVVITHGTDTMEETAYFLNLAVRSSKPVVLVGAMRSATSLSADGPINLYNAVALAASPQAREKGVLVMMNDSIYAARDVTKTNTSNVSTFQSPDFGILGYVNYGKVDFYRQSTRRHTAGSEFDISKVNILPRVDILYGHANHGYELVNAAIKAGAKGIVFAGVGHGNLYSETLKAMAVARKKGVVVVRSSRVGSGRVSLEGEVDDAAYQFVVADTLNAQKSRVLLMLALTQSQGIAEIQRMFFEY